MISEIRIDPSHEPAADPVLFAGRRELPLMCPHCQQPIRLAGGLCGNRQIDAIMLQAERIGTELECHRCGLRFVFHRTGAISQQRQPVTTCREHSETPLTVKAGHAPHDDH